MAAGIDIKIDTDTSAYQGFMREFPLQSSKAISKAMNKIGKSAEGAMIKQARAIYNIKKDRIKRFMSVHRSRFNNLIFELRISKRKNQPNITSFGAKELKKSKVSVSIIKGKRQKFQPAFITTFRKTGGKAAFKRPDDKELKQVPSKGKYKGKTSSRGPSKGKPIERQPIFPIYGPQILTMFSNPRVQDVFIKKANERAPIVIAQEMRFLANKLSAKHALKK